MAANGFQLDGSAPEVYQNVLVPCWFAPWGLALLQTLNLKPGDRVLDVACGTGIVTRQAADVVGPGGTVTGLDINAPMLDIARDLSTSLPIDWIESDVLDSGLPTDSFDTVISQHGYHYFPDKPGALGEFNRLLKPGGQLALSIWDDHSVYTAALSDAIERHISPETAHKQRSQRQTPSPDDLSSALQAAGFSNVRIITQTLEIRAPATRVFVPLHLASMPVSAAFNALEDTVKQALIDDVEHTLRDYGKDGFLIYPDTVNVAIGTK